MFTLYLQPVSTLGNLANVCFSPCLLYRLYQNDWYWDTTEFSDFFFIMSWTNLDLNTYIFEISIVLSVIRILVFAITPSVYMLLKESWWFLHLESERWIGAVNLFTVCCVSKKYDYINLHLNDNSTQKNQSIVFQFFDHKANIYPYLLFAKTSQLVDILYF